MREKVEDVVRFIENKQHRFYTQGGNSIAWVGCTTKVKFRQHLGWLTRESSLSRRMKQGIYEYAHTRSDRCAKHPYNSRPWPSSPQRA